MRFVRVALKTRGCYTDSWVCIILHVNHSYNVVYVRIYSGFEVEIIDLILKGLNEFGFDCVADVVDNLEWFIFGL